MGKQLGKDVTLKHYFLGVEEFMRAVKSLKTVYMAKTHGNLKGQENLLAKPFDMYGLGELGATNKFQISLDYGNKPMNSKFLAPIKNLFNKQQEGEFDSLICVGKDDSNAEIIFNINTYIQKIEIDIEKDSKGLYSPQEVRKTVIKELESTDRKNVSQT